MFKTLTGVKSGDLRLFSLSRLFTSVSEMCTNTNSPVNNSNVALRSLFVEAVKAVQPATLINSQTRLIDDHLFINDQSFTLPPKCFAVGFGKAVLGMAIELEQILGSRLERAIVTIPTGIFANYPHFKGKSKRIEFIEGAENNIPDREAVIGAHKITELVESLGENDFLIVLISGGGSALLPVPKPPISLEEKQNIIKSLGRGGASIQELNNVRKELSLVKGGGLAKLAYPAKVVSLILSDVVGDPLDVIASGPTVYSEGNSQSAIEILKRYDLYAAAPSSVKTALKSPPIQSWKSGKNKESSVTTCNNGEEESEKLLPNGEFLHVSNFIIGTNKIATAAVKKAAVEMGWQCVVVSHKVEQTVNDLAELYAQLADHIACGRIIKINDMMHKLPFEIEDNAVEDVLRLYSTRKILLIFAGEPTVLVTGTGKGGRNQQLALEFALELDKVNSSSTNTRNISLLSAGTDGIDGPTEAAGAIGYAGLVNTCARMDIIPQSFLQNNDSHNFFNKFLDGECLVKVGHTGTNVMDLHLLLIEVW